MRRDRLIFDMPQLLRPAALIGAMLAIALAAISDDDAWTYGAGVGLLVDAFFLRLYFALRER